MEEGAANRVLVVGHASSNSRHLIADVTGSDATRWAVENKYFSALVDFCFHDCDEPAPPGPWHGLVLVVDPTSRHESSAGPAFFDRWLPLAEEASVRALVAHSPSLDDLLPELRHEVWSSWCLENGLEFLEADMGSTPHGSRAAKSLLEDYGDDAEERGFGKERLLEALSSTMWPVLKKKERAEQPLPVAAPVSGVEKNAGKKGEKKGNDARELAEHELMAALAAEEDEPGAADVFERALTQAREMREHALSLPDEERREFASKMALQLMAMMGGLEDDNEDSDAEDGPRLEE